MSELLEERLQRLQAKEGRGDWLDVVRRARRRRRAARVRRALIVAAVLVLLAVPALAIADGVGWLKLTASNEDVPKPLGQPRPAYIFGDVLSIPGRPPAHLASPLYPTFFAYGPLAIRSPDGRDLLYQGSTRSYRPRLRLYTIETGRDIVLEEGAQSLAWRADGAIAFMRSLEPSATVPRRAVGHVFVRGGLNAPAIRWTTEPSLYAVRAWAGRQLLVSTQRLGEERRSSPRLLALAGPGRVRALPLSDVGAVSPDGRLVAGTVTNRFGYAKFVRVVDVASGRVVAQLDVRNRIRLGTGRQARTVLRAESYFGIGSWSGDSLAASTGGALELLRLDGKSLRRGQRFLLDHEALKKAGVRGIVQLAIGSPVFLAGGGDYLAVSVQIGRAGPPHGFVMLTCSVAAESCRVGKSFSFDVGRWKSLMLLENPSRPRPG